MLPERSVKIYNSLQLYRGVAVLMVILYHLVPQATHFLGFHHGPLELLAKVGRFGVDFFFVLSGFIILLSSYEKGGDSRLLPVYLLKRVIRIFVPYLPIGILVYMLYTILPGVSAASQAREISWITTLFLLPEGRPALSVAWTLVFEMQFYIIFALWFLSVPGIMIFAVLWILVLLLIGNYEWTSTGSFAEVFISLYNLEFMIGALCAVVVKNHKPGRPALVRAAAIGLLVLGFAAYFVAEPKYTGLIFALGFGLLIIGSIDTWLDGVSANSLLMRIGNASYSIYLVHGVVLSVGMRIAVRAGAADFPILTMLLTAGCALFVGMIYSWIFEKYLHARFKNYLLIKMDAWNRLENRAECR